MNKMTEEKVREIRKLAKEGVGIRELALQYKVGYYTIRDIVNERTWLWVGETKEENREVAEVVLKEKKTKQPAVKRDERDLRLEEILERDPHATRKDRWIPDDFPPFPEEWVSKDKFVQSDRRQMWGILKTDELREKMKRIWGGSGEEFEVDEDGQPVR